MAVLLSGLVWAATGLAAESPNDQVPKITNVKASPATFCAKKTAGCKNPGTTISFTLSTGATVRGDIRRRSIYRAPYVEFSKSFHQGANTIRLQDSRLVPDRWTLRLQGKNHVGSGGITLVDVRVVKR
jgi:hypothetical protein